MAKRGKIKCDCGGIFEEKMYPFGNILSPALVCQKCGYITLSASQAHQLQLLQRISCAEGQVKKQGHCLAICFPEEISKLGIKTGQRVFAQPIGKGSLKINFK